MSALNIKEEMDAAFEFATKSTTDEENFDNAYKSFLAGIEWQKNRYKKPEKEYYGC